MKFKYLIIAFSALIAIILLVVVFIPLMLSGGVNTVNLQQITFLLLAFMVLLLICVSVFFFLNYRLLSLLEREDWPALAYYLEQKIYTKKRYNSRYIRLLASSYLVISDFSSILKLENKIMLAKPSLISKNSRNMLIFGAARILNGNYTEAASFFKSYINRSNGKDRQWIRWFFGFSSLLSGDFASAEPEFSSLSVSSDDAVITGLSAYFLCNSLGSYSAKPNECREISENGKARVVNALKSINGWNKEVKKMGADIQTAIVKKYIDVAGNWIFDESST